MNGIIIILILSISIAVGIAFARTGTSEDSMEIACHRCGTKVPYKRYHKMYCPQCHRQIEVSDYEWDKRESKFKSNRFFIGAIGSLILLGAIASVLFDK